MADGEAATLEQAEPSRAQIQRPSLHLSGPQKAAVLLVSLGAEKASEIFRHLKEQEVEALSLEMAKTRRVAAATSAAIFSEVVGTIQAEDYIVEGGVDYAREVLEKSMGSDRASEIIGRLAATIERRPFEFLRRTPPEQIYMFLKNEPAQTIAVVVANLDVYGVDVRHGAGGIVVKVLVIGGECSRAGRHRERFDRAVAPVHLDRVAVERSGIVERKVQDGDAVLVNRRDWVDLHV